MNQSNAYRLSQQIELTRQAITRATAKIRYVELALKFGFVTTWLLYFIFAMGFYVADLWGLTTWITANTSELAAFTVFLCMAILMAQTLSMIKHVFYEHKAEFRYGLGIVLLIGLLGVFFELFNSSSQQQHMAFSHAEKSKTFESVANTVVNVSGAGDNSYQLAKLEGELAKAREYLAVCKKTCREYQAKVASLEAQANSLKDSSAHASATAGAVANSTIKAKAETMQALREDSHKPVFKFVRDSFGVSISTAVVLVAGIVAAGFEFSHALLSRILGEKLGMLSGLQQQLISVESAYIDATGKPYSGQATPTPADEPQHPEPDAVAEPKRQPFGFNLPPAQPATASKASPVLFKYQQQPEVKAERATFPMGFPIPAAAPAQPPQKPSAPDRKNPVLGTAEEQLALPDFGNFRARGGGWATPELVEPETPSKPQAGGLGVAGQETPSKPQAGGHGGLFAEWVAAVRAGACKPSVDPTWLWIQKRIAPKETGSRTHDRTRIGNMQKAFFARAIREGLMQANPNYRNGGKKYIWIGG